MISRRDPSGMSATERLVEIAFLLAVGYVRRISSKRVDDGARAEATCARTVIGPEFGPGKESA